MIHPAAYLELEQLGVITDSHRPVAIRSELDLELARDLTTITTPLVADTLDGKLALVERFDFLHADFYPGHGYSPGDLAIRVVPNLGPAWVVRWDRLTLALRDPGDLRYVIRISEEWNAARRSIRVDVMRVVTALRLPNRRDYLRPAASPARRLSRGARG